MGGKVVGKPGYFGLDKAQNIPEKLLKRIYGEVEAEGLADDVTADWGAIIENSKAFQQVEKWVCPHISTAIEKVFKKEVTLANARLRQEINRRLEKLPEHRREFARLAMERVMRKFYGETEERISPIVSVVLDTLERDEYWVVLQKIDDARHGDVENFAEALSSFGLLEIAMMAQQSNRRLQFLDDLDDLVCNADTKEQTIHKALEKNLWILGAEYSFMASNKTLAKTIEEYTGEKFSGERANKRPDLFLANDVQGKYLLIEFKRPSHTIKREDENQAEEYRDDLTPRFGKMDIIVLGKERDPKISLHYEKDDIKILSYTDIISRARTEFNWLLKELKSD